MHGLVERSHMLLEGDDLVIHAEGFGDAVICCLHKICEQRLKCLVRPSVIIELFLKVRYILNVHQFFKFRVEVNWLVKFHQRLFRKSATVIFAFAISTLAE